MAKAPRKKKPSNGSKNIILFKEIQSVVTRAYQELIFLGDSVNRMSARNIEVLSIHLRGYKHEKGMEQFLLHLSREMDWVLGTVCYFKVGEEYRSISCLTTIENISLPELELVFRQVLLDSINTCLESSDENCTQDNFVFYGYYLEPEVSPKRYTKLDGLMDFFINIYDFEQLNPFIEELPLPEFDEEDCIATAIKNARTFPRVKQISYDGKDEE